MKIKPLLFHPIFKSFVPLLIGGTYHLFKETLRNFALLGANLNFHEKLNDGKVQYSFPEEIMSSDFLSKLDHITFGIYSNFFAFLLAMLLIDGLFRILELGLNRSWKEAKSWSLSAFHDNRCSSSFSRKRSELIYQMSEKQIMRILSYALIFIILQIAAGFCFLSFPQSQTSYIHQPNMLLENSQDPQLFSRISRILEEEDEGASNYQLLSAPASPSVTSSEKISLSMGSVLSSLSLNANEMILSKDKQIAYVTLDYYGTLKVIDISDLQSPFVKGTLNLKGSTETYGYRVKSLLLSSDEKTLYASNQRELEIINVTDPSSPKLISLTKSEIFLDENAIDEVTKYMKTSLVVQESTKTLYIGGMGLQVYDISNPKKPALLKAFKNELKQNYGLLRNEIRLSRDEQVLFIATGTLNVYNISNPNDMRLLNSFTTESSPRSVLLSEDEKTLFLLGNSDDTSETIFEEVDISNSGSLKVLNSIRFAQESQNSPRFLAVSPCKSKFFVLADFSYKDEVDLLIFDRLKQTVINNEKSLIENVFALDFSTDGRILIAASNSEFMTVELFLNYPNRQIFSESLDNLISNFSLPGFCSKMQISNDGEYLFILRSENFLNSAASIFEIWDVRDQSEPRFSGSYQWDKLIREMHIAHDNETAYLIGDHFILVLDIKNQPSINVKKTYHTFDKDILFQHFTTSSDEKTGFVLTSEGDLPNVSFFDLSQSSITGVSIQLNSQAKISNCKLIAKDDNTLIIILEEGFLIYDVSNLDSPLQIASLPYAINEPNPDQVSSFLSPDKNTLYIETSDLSGFHRLRVYDLSVSASPQLIGEKDLSKREGKARRPGFTLSLKSGFIYEKNTLLKLNVTNPKEMEISGIIHLFSDQKEQVSNYLISPDGQTIYASVENQIRIINMNIKYTLFLKQEKFLLGEKYSGNVAILNLNGASDYDLVDPGLYKMTKLSLLDMRIAASKTSLEVKTSQLPSWIIFDRDSDSLTIEAKKQRDIGTYTFHSTFSLKIPKEIFKNLPVSSRDLWAWLISLDYVDPQLFLTANFGSEDDFYLPDKFENYTKEIYSTLKQFSFETCTSFEIVPSLEFKETQQEKSIIISTPSTNNLKVEIQLEPKNDSEAKFVSCPYGPLVPLAKNNNKSKISLEGSMKEINTALNSIVVNFENGRSCDASMILNDNFNPPVSINLPNVSRYFKSNKAPKLNKNPDKTVQEQIDGANIQTGVYFTFTLTNNIFEDAYIENLSYELIAANEKTAFPAWLSFSGLTLKGTPPEEVLGRDIDLILVAKNEFKESRVSLRLHVKMSLTFYLQLVLKYIPYVLTIVGVLMSANKIFNILGKPYYKHPKEFYLGAGEEISPEVIQPISFIKDELKQSQIILKYLDKRLPDLIDPVTKVLDKQKIIERIQKAINKMPPSDRLKLTKYPSPIIDKIIMNKLILLQLDSKDEAQTKALFEKLEPDCMEVIEKNPSLFSSELTINRNKLEKLIQRTQSLIQSGGLEENLMGLSIPPGINVELIKEVILVMAFDNHSVNILPIDLDIEVKQKVPANFLFRFLKLDLRDIYLNDKNKMNYGINYQIIDDKLCFYGVTQNYLKGKTLVVQVKSRHQRILKEIWIHGVSNGFQRRDTFMISNEEEEVRGQDQCQYQGYEIL